MKDVDELRDELMARRTELESELSSINEALRALGGRPARATVTRIDTPRAGGRASRDGRRTTRARQALGLVRENPGMKIPEIAAEIGIDPNYLYRVMPKLAETGQVKRDGDGWFPLEVDAPTVPAGTTAA